MILIIQVLNPTIKYKRTFYWQEACSNYCSH